MQRCFCCNARLKGVTTCPRCQADLSRVIATEKSAEYWLYKAIQRWNEGGVEQCLEALDFSLGLKKTALACAFRDYLIQYQCRLILDLLARKEILEAKKNLYQLRLLLPQSEHLQHLNRFSDYLLVNK